jgi:hypothetical protein
VPAAASSASPRSTTAFVPNAAPSPASGGSSSSLDALNRRLNALLPTNGDVSYDSKRFENPDLSAAVSQAEAGYYEAAAPPPSVLAKAIKVVKQSGTLLGPPTIVYILKRQRIFGFELCTGWQIIQTPTGPQGGYTVGPCSGESIVPSGGLPTLPPKRASP